jgi:RNA polymerase sigma-70 factor (ECF subfamily)
MSSESDMVADCLRGDAEAWDRLFDLHYAAVGRFVGQLSGSFSTEDVEEVCQETFLTVVRSLSSFKGRSRLQTWLFRIASNKARDFVERQRAQKRGGGEVALSLEAGNPETGLRIDPAGSGPAPDEALLNRERWGTLQAGLEALGEPCRETIELRYFGDLSYEEIAAALELNPKTVSSRLSKCLDRLGEIMGEKLRRENSAGFSV